MSILVRPISANLTRDTQAFERMDPYVKIYFGGRQYKTSTCSEGGRRPFWNDSFTLNPGTDTTLRIQVWDNDTFKDDLVGSGMYNLMNVYNMAGMRSDNQYVDLQYEGRAAGRILLSFTMQNMNNCWGQPTMMNNQMGGFNQPMNGGFGMQPPMNNGWGQQPPMNNGWGQQPPMNNGFGMQPPMNSGWGGNGMAPNNGWGNNMPPNNGFGNNMPPPNNGWGW